MTNTMNPQSLIDAVVYDPSGDKIGKVGEVYLREDSKQPAWITVKSGLFNHKETMVPLQGAHISEQGINVGVTKESINDAPHVDADGRLSEQDSADLYRHYGIQPDVPTSRGPMDSPPPGRGRQAGNQAQDTMDGGRSADGRSAGGRGAGGRGAADGRGSTGRGADGQAEMIRSEERLNVGTEQVESGKVRLHKYVVTEQQQITVPVSHEEVRVEREPISDTDRAGAMSGRGGKLEESDEEITLHAERPVVNTETVAVERVRVGKETVTEDETVAGQVRKERVDIDSDQPERKRNPNR
jgi:uncharacterized protein (TIGR02271 family)